MQKNKATTFQTSNLYQASFLAASGFKVLGTKKVGEKTAVIFEGENIEAEALQYYNDKKMGSKSLFNAYRLLKDLIFQK